MIIHKNGIKEVFTIEEYLREAKKAKKGEIIIFNEIKNRED